MMLCSSLLAEGPADLHMRVQLVWGTDGAPPEGTKYNPLELQIKNRLARVFKWKNYFLIHEQKFVLGAQDDEKRLKLSAKCEIELKRLDSSTLQIKLFGEGKWTKTVRRFGHQAVPTGTGLRSRQTRRRRNCPCRRRREQPTRPVRVL